MCIYIFFKSGNFLTSIIILLIFIRRVYLREKGEKDKLCMREKKSCSYVKSYQVSFILF